MSFILLISFILALFQGSLLMETTMSAFELCLYHLFPSLFFTMVCIRTLCESNFFFKQSFPWFEKLLNIHPHIVPFLYAIILMGMPSGALLLQQAYQQKKIALNGIQRILYACCFVTPAFVIITVGQHLLHSISKGILLYIAHILGGLFLLLHTRNTPIIISQPMETKKITFSLLYNIMIKSIYIIIMMSGIIILCMSAFHLWFSILPPSIINLLFIPIEFSNGIFILNDLNISSILKEYLILSLICFNGLCIHIQYFSLLEDCQLHYLIFLKHRFFHILYSILIYSLFLFFQQVFLL